MRSTTLDDDRTAKARIRDAAIECFAEHGTSATTARRVADIAGVSPGLVIHHFGSMDGLRAACDEHVAAVIRETKSSALSAGPNVDILAALRQYEGGNLGRYLANVLTDDSPAVARLVDDIVADAEAYIDEGVRSGIIQPSQYPGDRAALLALWQLGAIVLHRHMDRLLGIDLTDPDATTNPAIANYATPVYEMLSGGFFTNEFASRLAEAMASLKEALLADHPSADDEGTP
jgi:AcrR family transcriptional regulator